ncbi:MAG TPA: FtsH protease activity modulator HflK [Anaerolineales bacterium]|nr:FtsH protease activity modulator HflK [Anaerolineales bacterium]
MKRSNVPKEPGLGNFIDPEWISRTMRRGLSRRLIWILLLGAVGLWLLSGFYMVGPGERGIVLTFGRLSGQSESGLHYRLPVPFQSHYIVDTARVRTAEIGYRTEAASQNVVLEEAQMLTGDENMVVVQLFIQYLVQDPVAYLFHVRDAETVLNASAEIALRSAVGQNTIDFTMTEGRVQAQDQVKTHLQELLDQYQTGLLVTEARLLAVDPPVDVRDAFHDVVRAFEDRERLVKEAEGYAEQVVPEARGEAAQMVLEAEAYREQRLIRAEGDAARFLALLAEYRKAPEVMRERLYLESIERVLSGAEIFVLETGSGGVLPFLPLTDLAPTATPPAILPTEPTPAP